MNSNQTQAVNMIAQAMLLVNKSSFFEERGNNPVEMMSLNLGSEMIDLLQNSDENITDDWGFASYHYKSLLTNLVVLLGKPGVLDKLPEYERELATERLNFLVEFFESMEQDEKAHAFLNYVRVINKMCDEETAMQIANYYDFTQRNNVHSSFFDALAKKEECKYEQRYKEIPQAKIQ